MKGSYKSIRKRRITRKEKQAKAVDPFTEEEIKITDNEKMLNLTDDWENARQKRCHFCLITLAKRYTIKILSYTVCEKSKLAGLPYRAICQCLFAS